MTIRNHNGLNITYRINPPVSNEELNQLSAFAWQKKELIHKDSVAVKGIEFTDFASVLRRSLAFVCAYHSSKLIGFVNVAWDGGLHAFILDTMVHPDFQRRAIGLRLVKQAIALAKKAGVEWLHVDFEPHLKKFYDKCGFTNTNAGLINLKRVEDADS